MRHGQLNLTADHPNSQTDAFDAWNRLVSAATASYEYDALGRRIEVTYSAPTTDPAVDFYYSNQGQVLEERESGASVAKRQYVWSAVYVDAMVLRDQDSGTDGTLDERLYAQQDANFNVTAVIDTSGTVVERYNYEPFGQFIVLDADWSSDADGVSDVNWVHLHQGGRWDANAKLYHFGARDYDPELARWTSPDPLGYVDGANLYQYEGSDPTGMLDPMGTWGFGGAVGSVLGSGGGGPGAVAIEKPSDASRVSHFANATTQPATNKAKDQSGLNNGTGTCTTNKCPSQPPSSLMVGLDLEVFRRIANEYQLNTAGKKALHDAIRKLKIGKDLSEAEIREEAEHIRNLSKKFRKGARGAVDAQFMLDLASAATLLFGAWAAIQGSAHALDTDTMMQQEYERAMNQLRKSNPLWKGCPGQRTRVAQPPTKQDPPSDFLPIPTEYP